MTHTSTQVKIFHPFSVIVAVLGFSLLQFFAQPSHTIAAPLEGLNVLSQIETVLIELAEQVKPSVVNIAPLNAENQPTASRPNSRRPLPGTGSGAIIDKDGYIVTNNHVVGDAKEVEVRLWDKSKYVARVVGRDKDTDLALLKIDADTELTAVAFGDSSLVRVGQWVMAVGNPFGLDRTVTFGVVSGLGRANMNLSRYENFIQTDASINPGNSGGPLFAVTGEVIGINTAILNFAQGIGFAIPSNLVQQIVNQLRTHGKVTRGWLGVGIQGLTPELAEKFGVAENAGVLVNEVFEGDPADKAGIRPGDIITKVDGEPVDTPNALSLMIATFSPLAEVTIEVIRDGKTHTFQGALGERKDETVVASVPSDKGVDINLGLNLQALTSELAEKFKLKDTTGVIISQVEPDSISQQAGLREGDLIKDVDQQEIASIEDFNTAVRKVTPGQSILLRVIRENRAFYVVLNTEE